MYNIDRKVHLIRSIKCIEFHWKNNTDIVDKKVVMRLAKYVTTEGKYLYEEDDKQKDI